MKAIILSAGRGSRMGKLTDNSPKSLTKLFDKPLLEYQINALKSAGISEIGIITGYKSEALEPFIASHNLIAFHNESFADSNMVYSMLCAREWLENSDFVVSYSDIFYDASGVRDLANLQCDAGILYATNWLTIWQERFPNNVLDDAESFRLDSENNLLEIGSKAKSIDEIQGQFMGLMKFSKEGFKSLCQMLQTLDIKALDSTAMLQKFIESKQCVKCVAFSGVWGEVDSQSDIKIYEKMYSIKANSACSDFLGSASASSLQRTESASHSSASHNPKNSSTILEFANENSSLGNHCIDLAFRHKARTPSPLTLCQNTKNSTSKTSNTRIFLNANDAESQSDSAKDSADSIESAKDSSHSTQGLKDSITSSHSIKSLKDSIDSAESFHDSNDSAESSNKMDCHDSATQNLAMTDKGDSMESTKIISHAETCGLSRNDASLSSLRGDLSPKQSINENISAESRRIKRIESAESLKDSNDSIELNHKIDCHESQSDSHNDGNFIDCHDSATQNLAMTDKGDSAESRRNESVESFTKSQKESAESKTQSHKDSSHSIKSLKDSIDSAESFHDSTNSTQSIKDSTTSSDSSFHIKDGHK